MEQRDLSRPGRPASLADRASSSMAKWSFLRAQRPQPPPDSPLALERAAQRKGLLHAQEAVESIRIYRGLILLAVLALLFSLVWAGADRVFVPGWWRQW